VALAALLLGETSPPNRTRSHIAASCRLCAILSPPPALQVLHNGLLWGFNGSFLGARLRLVLPILGAKLGKTPPSSRAHPFSFTVTINPYFMEDELLATTEFAAPSLAERVAWMQILNETACKVSKMFRRTADKVAHVHSVDVQDASAALWDVREHFMETQQL